MPKVEFYGYSRCSTCRQAEALLSEIGVTYERRDLFSDRLSPHEAGELYSRIGLKASDVISTRSRPFRELELADRELSESEILTLMGEHPALIRRPIVVKGDKALIGFKPDEIRELVD